MKKLFIAAVVVFLTSCEEPATVIEITVIPKVDTTYRVKLKFKDGTVTFREISDKPAEGDIFQVIKQ